jgi:hypothetical protein
MKFIKFLLLIPLSFVQLLGYAASCPQTVDPNHLPADMIVIGAPRHLDKTYVFGAAEASDLFVRCIYTVADDPDNPPPLPSPLNQDQNMILESQPSRPDTSFPSWHRPDTIQGYKYGCIEPSANNCPYYKDSH